MIAVDPNVALIVEPVIAVAQLFPGQTFLFTAGRGHHVTAAFQGGLAASRATLGLRAVIEERCIDEADSAVGQGHLIPVFV